MDRALTRLLEALERRAQSHPVISMLLFWVALAGIYLGAALVLTALGSTTWAPRALRAYFSPFALVFQGPLVGVGALLAVLLPGVVLYQVLRHVARWDQESAAWLTIGLYVLLINAGYFMGAD